jgi:hypothetical protein
MYPHEDIKKAIERGPFTLSFKMIILPEKNIRGTEV